MRIKLLEQESVKAWCHTDLTQSWSILEQRYIHYVLPKVLYRHTSCLLRFMVIPKIMILVIPNTRILWIYRSEWTCTILGWNHSSGIADMLQWTMPTWAMSWHKLDNSNGGVNMVGTAQVNHTGENANTTFDKTEKENHESHL